VAVRPHPGDAAAFLCVLADGQGGQRGGAAAAQTAVTALLEAASVISPKALLRPAVWEKLGAAADKAVLKDAEAGFCTLVALCVTPTAVCGVSCGDSAAVLYHPDERVLTEQQYKNPPVGSGGARWVSFEAKLTVGAKLLLTSDGVWKYAGWEKMAEHAAVLGGNELIAVLRAEVLERNRALPDDFSMIVLEVK
jgi:serine/threonine protein phosphatase PrpC